MGNSDTSGTNTKLANLDELNMLAQKRPADIRATRSTCKQS